MRSHSSRPFGPGGRRARRRQPPAQKRRFRVWKTPKGSRASSPCRGRPRRARPFLRQRPARSSTSTSLGRETGADSCHGPRRCLDAGRQGQYRRRREQGAALAAAGLHRRLAELSAVAPAQPARTGRGRRTRARLRPGACCRLGRRRIASRPHGPFVGRAPRGPLDRRTGHCRSHWRRTVAWLGLARQRRARRGRADEGASSPPLRPGIRGRAGTLG